VEENQILVLITKRSDGDGQQIFPGTYCPLICNGSKAGSNPAGVGSNPTGATNFEIMEYEVIGKTLPFKQAAELFSRSTYVTSVDDGWASIIKVDDKYYRCEYGLPEYEGHIYLEEVKYGAHTT
jgi:hypothetical protein